MNKHYLGDGVYVELDDIDPNTIVLTTNNGIVDTNKIVLEIKPVLQHFLEWLGRNGILKT